MHRFLFLLGAVFLASCASMSYSGYIAKIDHPYTRQFYASFEKVTSACMYCLKKQGWVIMSEVDPATYERDERYENNGYQNLLIMTAIKKSNRLVYTKAQHLNIFIHALNNNCDVEIRYEGQTSLIKQFNTSKNDAVVEKLLDAIDQEIHG